jgi:hypothetical protein
VITAIWASLLGQRIENAAFEKGIERRRCSRVVPSAASSTAAA